MLVVFVFGWVLWGAFGGEVRALGLGFGGFVWRVAPTGLFEPGGFGLRRLFDNFIGRKRDVDGGVLAGLSGL